MRIHKEEPVALMNATIEARSTKKEFIKLYAMAHGLQEELKKRC